MPNKKTIRIVIVNWRSGKVILECLESIRKAGFIESVVVVDNGSNDGSLEKIRNQKPEIRIIENGENLGFAEGNNRGIEDCSSQGVKYIFILNPDTEINKDTIPNLLEVMEKDGSIGICGPKIYTGSFTSAREHPRGVPQAQHHPWGGRVWSCGGVLDKKRYSGGLIGLGEIDNDRYDKVKEVDFISGTAMMVRREVFEKCGMFNPDYFIYYEDVELNLKAKKMGFRTVFAPSAEILHKESTSVGKNSPTQEYYMARNHLLFVERNASISVRLRELIRLPKTIYQHWKRREIGAIRGIKDYFLRRFGKRDYWS